MGLGESASRSYDLRIDTEQTTYRHSTLAVEDPHLRFVGACQRALVAATGGDGDPL